MKKLGVYQESLVQDDDTAESFDAEKAMAEEMEKDRQEKQKAYAQTKYKFKKDELTMKTLDQLPKQLYAIKK